MREFITDKVKEIKPSGIRKFFDIASTLDDCISLGVGEPDFETPWHISEVGIQAIEEGKTFYTTNVGLKQLRQEVAKWNKLHYGLEYDEDEVIITVGGSQAIDTAIRSVVEKGDEVIVLQPDYVCYEPDVLMSGGVVKTIQLKNENQFKLQPQQLEEAISDKTKVLLLNYPNNPTGAIMSKEDLLPIAEIVKKHDLLVISDEIYSELTYGKKHCSIASFEGMKERTLVINGFSKTYAMTGWRLGYLMGPNNLITQIKKVHQYAVMSANTISQYAAIEALTNGEKDIIRMRDEYNNRRLFLLSEYQRLGLPCFVPDGAFYTFPDIRKYGLSSEEFANRLLEDQRVVVVPGTAFSEAGEGFVRISYAYSIDDLKKAMKRIEAFLNKL